MDKKLSDIIPEETAITLETPALKDNRKYWIGLGVGLVLAVLFVFGSSIGVLNGLTNKLSEENYIFYWMVLTGICAENQPETREKALQARFKERLVETILPRLVERVGAQTHGAIFADNLAVGGFFEILEFEKLLRDDHGAFHADDLGDVGHTTRTVAQTFYLNDQINRFGNLA